jgi:hypothetical protein
MIPINEDESEDEVDISSSSGESETPEKQPAERSKSKTGKAVNHKEHKDRIGSATSRYLSHRGKVNDIILETSES